VHALQPLQQLKQQISGLDRFLAPMYPQLGTHSPKPMLTTSPWINRVMLNWKTASVPMHTTNARGRSIRLASGCVAGGGWCSPALSALSMRFVRTRRQQKARVGGTDERHTHG
jgi:hypothetical protein